MLEKNKYDQKHLTTTQRIKIEKGLNDGKSMTEIGRIIAKHPTTISKEVKKYRTFNIVDHSDTPLRCALFKECSLRFLCDDAAKKDCVKMCKYCYDVKMGATRCSTTCPEYRQPICQTPARAPFVCNSCLKAKRCNKSKAFYIAQSAEQSSQALLISCRSGINQEPADIALLDDLISPLLKQGQSLAHIYAFHGHEIPCCRKTLYNYIDQGVFTAKKH